MTALLAVLLALQGDAGRTLDDFEHPAWTAHPADGVELTIRPDAGRRGRAMRLDFVFHGGGYAVARRELPFDLPADYELSFYVRGAALPNNFEFKLIDSTGDNVWWLNRREFHFPHGWTRYVIRKRDVVFAWGPAGGGEPHHVAAIEIAVTAGQGGSGSVWIDDLTLTPRAAGKTPGPVTAVATSSLPGAAPAATLDGDSTTAWRSGRPPAGGERQTLQLDFGAPREFGGLEIRWDTLDYAVDYDIETSDDARRWDVAARIRGAAGGRAYQYLPERESRYVRLQLRRSARHRGYAIAEITVQPLEFSASPNQFFAAVARAAPPGSYPRYFSGRQSYWTVVGVNGDGLESLLNDDGMLEARPHEYSVEPFLFVAGQLTTWHDVERSASLRDGDLPIPTVQWRAGALTLAVTAFADGAPGAGRATTVALYRVTNAGGGTVSGRLFLAIRPFQVNPPWQNLNTTGGAAAIERLDYDGRAVRVNGGVAVVPLAPPSGFGAASFDQGGVIAALRRGVLPPARAAMDVHGWASGALAYDFSLAAGESREVAVALRTSAVSPDTTGPVAERLAAAASSWEAAVGGVDFVLPPAAARFKTAIRSTLAYILLNRAGPALHPGPRAYARSWIRDGALIDDALLRLGRAGDARAFVTWFAGHQYPNGKVPCCVDARGADPVPEHDSQGEFIYAIAQYYRFSQDRGVLEQLWPGVAGAAAYIDTLRRQRLTSEFLAPERREFYGILPPSISHEGYSAKAMHSYWDDFWALRGLRDAAFVASVLGDAAAAGRLSARADSFQADFAASIERAMARHGIDFIPGSADLGDFDATSTAIAVAPTEALSWLPAGALRRTFDRYYEAFEQRRTDTAWTAYTPYELRNAGVFLRLGQPQRARALLETMLEDRRPDGWNEWPEVVWRDREAPNFFGDLPHTWVGAEFLRSALDLFAFERERDSSLVIAAGVPLEWMRSATGVAVRGLGTPYGTVSYTIKTEGDRVMVHIEGDLRMPPGGVVIAAPPGLTPAGEQRVRALPADVEFHS